MFADVMAPGLLIHRSTFCVGGNIGTALPINLLQMDELKQGGGIQLCLVLLEALFGRQFSWMKFIFLLYSIFWFFLVDCYMVRCPSFASFA
jgi:hypothetical protein